MRLLKKLALFHSLIPPPPLKSLLLTIKTSPKGGSASGSVEEGFTFTFADSDATLEAQWTENSYTIEFSEVYNSFQVVRADKDGVVYEDGIITITSENNTVELLFTDILVAGSQTVSTIVGGTSVNITGGSDPTRTGYVWGVNSVVNDAAVKHLYVLNNVTGGYRYSTGWLETSNINILTTECFAFSELNGDNGATVSIEVQWSPVVYDITLNGNQGTGSTSVSVSPANTVYIAYNDNTFYGAVSTDLPVEEVTGSAVVPMATRDGYSFLGWFVGDIQITNNEGALLANVSGYTDANSRWIHTENVTFDAHWSQDRFAIHLNLNEGSLTNENISNNTVYALFDSQTLYVDQTSSTTVNPVAERTGYTFLGWSTTQDDEETIIIDASGNLINNFTSTSATTEVYACWQVNTYGVILDLNTEDASAEIVSDVQISDNTIYITYGTQNIYNARENGTAVRPTATRTGYTFVGWSQNPDATTLEQCIINEDGNMRGNSSIATEGTTIYAVWAVQSFYITIDLTNGHIDTESLTITGSDLEATQTNVYRVAYESNVRISFNTLAGYTFDHFTVLDEDGTEINDLTINTVSNGYEFVMPAYNFTLVFNSKANLIGATLNLNDEVGGTKADALTTELSDGIYIEYASTNIYADRTDITTPVGEAITVVATRDGYNFLGWSLSGSATTADECIIGADGALKQNFTSSTTDGVILYAIWEKTEVSYKINYYFENILDSNFTHDTARQPDVVETGEVDTAVNYLTYAVDIAGFTYSRYETNNTNNQSTNIRGDGNLVINLYYTRDLFDLTINNNNGDELEFLWEKFPENAICRRKDNKKWYVAFIRLPKNKLSLNGTEKVDILDVRSDEVEKLIDNKTILPAYHMNKKNWVTILLDGNGDLKTVYDLVDKSYLLAKKK